MRQKSGPEKQPAEDAIRDIRRATRRHFSAEEKIRIVLEGLRGEESIAELCRREGIASWMYYGWSKELLEAGKRRLAGDTARAATSDEVKDLRRETQALKEVVADLTLENRLLKKSMIADGGDEAWDIPHPTRLRSSGWSSNRICRLDGPWKSSAFPDRHFTGGMIGISAADLRPSRIAPHGQIGFGTGSRRLSAVRLSTWRWINPNSARGNWRCASRTRKNTLSQRRRFIGF
jgi:transposase